MLHTDPHHCDYRTRLLFQNHFVIDTDALKKWQKSRDQDIILWVEVYSGGLDSGLTSSSHRGAGVQVAPSWIWINICEYFHFIWDFAISSAVIVNFLNWYFLDAAGVWLNERNREPCENHIIKHIILLVDRSRVSLEKPCFFFRLCLFAAFLVYLCLVLANLGYLLKE